MRWGLPLIFVMLSGCTVTSETVHLRNSGGMTVQCGPYRGGNAPLVTVALRNCVEDFQRQGYERLP